LTMQNFTMFKMFLSAAVVSTATIQWMNGKKLISLSPPNPSWLKTAAGGVILGCAMYISGACPGTVLAQVGPGVTTAQQTLLGGVLGAFAFGIFEPFISKLFPKPKSGPSANVDSLFNISKRSATILMISGLCSMLAVLEYIKPWQTDLGLPLSVSTWNTGLFASVWSPYLGGSIVGLLQIPSFLMMNNGLGCSSGYVSLISQIMGPTATTRFDYFKSYYGTATSIWQLFLDVGVVLGSGVCYWILSPHPPAFAAVTTSTLAFIGGFLLIFGARLAQGCTSGHGLTGMGKLHVGSILAVASMFGGGMLTAFIASVLRR